MGGIAGEGTGLVLSPQRGIAHGCRARGQRVPTMHSSQGSERVMKLVRHDH